MFSIVDLIFVFVFAVWIGFDIGYNRGWRNRDDQLNRRNG